MNPRDYFPLGKAHGEAFCNREEETAWLLTNIQACKHSLLLAPRRFGKSSLAEKAVSASKLPTITLNFNTCSDEEDIEALIRMATGQLISRAIGPVDKAIRSIKNYVTHLVPKIVIGGKYAQLELSASQPRDVSANLEETLNLIEKLLKDKRRSAVMIFDEFQTVGTIAKGAGVEAAIRNVAQDMKQLSIIFSGSNRSLLQTMFDDESRPLYKICRKLRVRRIEKTHYHKHLNLAAKLAWKKTLPEDVFDRIIHLSERHPYYLNYLCDVIWTECQKLPDVNAVDHAWQIVMNEEESDANAEIATLSLGQKKLIKHIATHGGANLLSSQVIQETGMALSSLASAVTGLMEKDVIEKQEDQYIIINPMLKYQMQESRWVG